MSSDSPHGFVAEQCPLCGETGNRLFEVHGYPIIGCPACHHRWAGFAATKEHVDKVYDDVYFEGGGAGYPDYLGEASILKRHGQRYAKLLARYTKPGKILDVGCAAGFILSAFTDAGWTGVGVEPNESMARHARDVLGLNVHTTPLEDYRSEETFDAVCMVQVLPHLVDPVSALGSVAEITAADGYWLIETWNRESWTARFFGKAWHEYSPPSVLHWFSPAGVRELVARYGFRHVADGRPQKWISGAHAKSLSLFKSGNRRAIRFLVERVPDNVKLPYPAEDLRWMLFKRD